MIRVVSFFSRQRRQKSALEYGGGHRLRQISDCVSVFSFLLLLLLDLISMWMYIEAVFGVSVIMFGDIYEMFLVFILFHLIEESSSSECSNTDD